MRGSSCGKGPLQSSKLSLSQKSSNASISLMTGQQTPHLLSERFCSLLDAQISPQTSGSTLLRDMRSTFQRSLECTTPLGELYQLSIRVPKQSKAITSHGDWVIVFGKTIQAISYTLPGRNSEYVAYQAYMLGLFASITPSFHSRVIDLDKAIRLRTANQKHLRLSDFARFDNLRTIYLTSFGVGLGARDGEQGSSKRRARPTLPGGGEPCHNWNRGTCCRPASECPYSHVCDHSGCGEAHNNQSIQSQSLNQELSRGQKFRRHFVWDPAAVVRSRIMCWTELAESLPSPPASEFDNVKALDIIHSHPDLFVITTPRSSLCLCCHP